MNRSLWSLVLGLLVLCDAWSAGASRAAPRRAAGADARPVGQRPGEAPARLPDPLVSRLDRRVPELMQAGLVPGLALALVRDREVVSVRSFGVANAETGAPVTDDTVFEAASLSKPVFARAVLVLVDRGVLDLDQPLTRYMPGTYDVGDDPRLGQITARHVLSHQSGFPNWRPRGDASLKIHFTPGERFSYSGEGFVFLSEVVEHVTGTPLERVMRTLVFEPIGMTSSSFTWQDGYEARKAFNHDGLGTASGRPRPDRPNAAASLQTTARDYARFVSATLDGSGLKPETVRQMRTPQAQLHRGGPNTIGRPPGAPLPGLAWGLGWGLEQASGETLLWHWGDNGNNKSFVAAQVDRGAAVVVFVNSANGQAIMPEIVAAALDRNGPGRPTGVTGPERSAAGSVFEWLDYTPYTSPLFTLQRTVAAKGAAAALAEYRAWRKDRPPGEWATERAVNDLGYALLRAKRLEDAIAVFLLNVEDHPQSFNAHDSLAEAYAAHGQTERAIEHYQRSLDLNPKNTSAIEALKTLRNKKG